MTVSISEPDRGRRKWKDDLDAQEAVYANRRRIRGERGKRLQRRRGELIERPFAHLYETGHPEIRMLSQIGRDIEAASLTSSTWRLHPVLSNTRSKCVLTVLGAIPSTTAMSEST